MTSKSSVPSIGDFLMSSGGIRKGRRDVLPIPTPGTLRFGNLMGSCLFLTALLPG